MRINSNSSIGITNQISKTSKKINSLFGRLSSGKSVNSAKDNPTALALANSLKSQSSGLQTANRNIAAAQSTLQTASGGISQSIDQLQGLRDLAVQAANGTLSGADRQNLQEQFSQGIENLDSIASDTNFNGNSLLDGSFSQNIQVGPESGQTQSVAIDGVSSSDLGLSGQNINSQAAAQDAIAAIDSAIAAATSTASKIGASESALEYRANANAIQAENLEAARSQAEDADFAPVTSDLSRESVIQQAQIAVLKEQIKQQTQAASLLIQKK